MDKWENNCPGRMPKTWKVCQIFQVSGQREGKINHYAYAMA